MNEYFYKTIWITIITATLFIFNGCSDNLDKQQGSILSTMVCTDWGASQSEVMYYMANYEMNIMDNDFICYIGRNNVQTISYQFLDEGLQASLLLIPQDKISSSELQLLFGKYEYLGEKNGLDIYVNETTNTMATITQKIKGKTTYYAIGYTMLD